MNIIDGKIPFWLSLTIIRGGIFFHWPKTIISERIFLITDNHYSREKFLVTDNLIISVRYETFFLLTNIYFPWRIFFFFCLSITIARDGISFRLPITITDNGIFFQHLWRPIW